MTCDDEKEIGPFVCSFIVAEAFLTGQGLTNGRKKPPRCSAGRTTNHKPQTTDPRGGVHIGKETTHLSSPVVYSCRTVLNLLRTLIQASRFAPSLQLTVDDEYLYLWYLPACLPAWLVIIVISLLLSLSSCHPILVNGMHLHRLDSRP